jgi:TATA-box binding protein (TBP) (component of TFIID and TFIIIB)
MAKKSFMSGLDNLLASAGIKKKVEEKEIENPLDQTIEKKEISEDESHWLLIKMKRLNEELLLWRTGKLNVNEFHESLKKFGLKFDQNNNQIVEE